MVTASAGQIFSRCFLSAMATAMRLEKAVDRYLVRPNGLYYLNLDRTWRIGATAHRIISLAESNGSRFRDLR